MSKKITEQNKEILQKELNLLNALGRVSNTEDGSLVLSFILEESCINYDPFAVSKNSGDTSNLLGKQSVGRAVVDKMIEAGVNVRGKIFSRKSDQRIYDINKELENYK